MVAKQKKDSVEFEVTITNFRALNIISKKAKEGGEEKQKNETKLYLKVNFDDGYAVFQTEKVSQPDAAQIQWRSNGFFTYHLPATNEEMELLKKKYLKIECWKHNMIFSDRKIGSANVSVWDVATGANAYDLLLRDDDGNPVGHVLCEIEMNQIVTGLSVCLSNTEFKLDTVDVDKDSFLSISYSKTPHLPVQSRQHASRGKDLTWQDLPILNLSAVCCAHMAREYILVELKRKKTVIAQGKIPLFHVFSLKENKPSKFTYPLFSKKEKKQEPRQIGAFNGVISFLHLPRFCQLHGGVYTTSLGLVDQSEHFPGVGQKYLLFDGALLPETCGPDGSDASSSIELLPRDFELFQVTNPPVHKDDRAVKFEYESGEEEEEESKEEIQELINQLQVEHEAKLAGLKSSFEKQKNDQRARIEARLKMRKKQLERQETLQAPILAISPVVDRSNVVRSREEIEKDLETMFSELQNDLYQALSDEKSPRTANVAVDITRITPFPPGWEMRFTESGRPYYTFKLNGKFYSIWNDPRLMPADWEMKIDEQGRTYFFNRPTGLQTYLDIRALPEGWIAFMDMDREGKVLFYFNDMVTETDPRGLPPGFRACIDPATNKVQFISGVNQVVSEDPRTLQGITDDVRALWRDLELKNWLDLQREELFDKELKALDNSLEDAQSEIKAWIAGQRDIVANYFEKLQLNILQRDQSTPETSAQHLIQRFNQLQQNLENGWQDELRKTELEWSKVKIALINCTTK